MCPACCPHIHPGIGIVYGAFEQQGAGADFNTSSLMRWLKRLHPLAPIDDRTRPANHGNMHSCSRLTLPPSMPFVRQVFEFEELMHRHRETRCPFFHLPPASAFGTLSHSTQFIRKAGARSYHNYDGISGHGHHASYLTCAWEARQPSANPSTGDLYVPMGGYFYALGIRPAPDTPPRSPPRKCTGNRWSFRVHRDEEQGCRVAREFLGADANSDESGMASYLRGTLDFLAPAWAGLQLYCAASENRWDRSSTTADSAPMAGSEIARRLWASSDSRAGPHYHPSLPPHLLRALYRTCCEHFPAFLAALRTSPQGGKGAGCGGEESGRPR
ncbi:hypothetical protein FKP32DRAFT_1605734 [Trametes sanguinea]|nr:hypothetical protein FKP32DRAFT_1605734 [Trametes sanguinea]